MHGSDRDRDHLAQDELIDLLHGLMSDAGEATALEHLVQCPACEDRFRLLSGHQERVLARGRATAAARGRRERPPVSGDRSAASRERWSKGRTIALAGVAAAIVLYALPRLVPDRPAEQYWLPVEEDQISLRSLSEAERPLELLSALDAYREHDARGALERLQNAHVPPSYRELRDIYLASALTIDGRLEEGARVLAGLNLETMPQPWRSHGQWTLYLVLKGRGETGKASEVLQELLGEEGVVGERAREEWNRESRGGRASLTPAGRGE